MKEEKGDATLRRTDILDFAIDFSSSFLPSTFYLLPFSSLFSLLSSLILLFTGILDTLLSATVPDTERDQ